jgi:hypothetical protein
MRISSPIAISLLRQFLLGPSAGGSAQFFV